MQETTPSLKRTLTLPLMIFYGLGTMIGGGIYALTGKVAGEAGMYAPMAFVLAAVLAGVTACAYAELVARLPFSAGEAHYVDKAFNRPWFTHLIGWAAVFMGLISSAALATAAAGFLEAPTGLPEPLLTVAVVLIMAGVAVWGISESVFLISAITVIEVTGLVLVIVLSGESLLLLPERLPSMLPLTLDPVVWSGIAGAAVLAFYAFIGFEDMVNVAEEVKDVERTLPIAIAVCLLITLVLYMLISLVGVLSVAPEVLASSKAPMVEILKHNGAESVLGIMGLVSLMAVTNGALVQVIKASRIVFGLAQSGKAPAMFAAVHPVTRTPVYATVLVTAMMLGLALLMDLAMLATISSSVVIFVFACINASAWRIKTREAARPEGVPYYPLWLNLFGCFACAVMLCVGLWKVLA